jgi:hypothetical protein
MSGLPGFSAQPMTGGAQPQPQPVTFIESIFGSFNTNLYFIGIMMLLLNLGGRFLAMEITKDQETFFQNPWVRRFLIFVVLFVGTRNLMISFWLTITVVLLLGYLFNENSALCIIGKKGVPGSKCAEKGGAKPGMTPEESEIFRRLNEKRLRNEQAAAKEAEETGKKTKFVDPSLVYMANMSLLSDVST